MTLSGKLLFPMLLALSGCGTGSTAPIVLDSYCKTYGPISYDSEHDTPETVKAIEEQNSRWVCVCEHDCPSTTPSSGTSPPKL